MEDMREFVAYCRKLLRTINNIEKALEDKDSEKALELVRELKEDTQKEIGETERAADLPKPPNPLKIL